MNKCYNSYKKTRLLKLASYLLKQDCCDYSSCSELSKDLQDAQFKCNDIFGEVNISEKDDKGNIKDTICSKLKDKKIIILNRFKPTKNVTPQSGLNSSLSMTDKEINSSPEGADLNLQQFKGGKKSKQKFLKTRKGRKSRKGKKSRKNHRL
jgi:hypothetical protein